VTTFAFAALGYDVPRLFEVLEEEALGQFDALTFGQLKRMIWSFALAGHLTPKFEKRARETALREGEMADASAFVADPNRNTVQHGMGNTSDDSSREDLVKDESKVENLTQEEAEEEGAFDVSAFRRKLWEPSVLAEGKHWIALYKPPAWDVGRTAFNFEGAFEEQSEEVGEEEWSEVLTEAKPEEATFKDFADGVDAGSEGEESAWPQSDPIEFSSIEPDPDDEFWPRRSERDQRQLQNWFEHNLGHLKGPIHSDPKSLWGIMSRLDYKMSGVLLTARTHIGANWLALQWAAGAIEKEYICLARGWVNRSIREVTKRVRVEREWRYDESRERWCPFSKTVVSPMGKPHRTELVTLAHLIKIGSEDINWFEENGEFDERYSLVALKLKFGKAHQLRAHMSSLGHPFVCDKDHAGDIAYVDNLWCSRTFLHAYRLAFEDVPEDGSDEGNKVSAVCALPTDLRSALWMLRPVDERSSKHHADWLSGESERMRSFASYAEEAALAEEGSGNAES